MEIVLGNRFITIKPLASLLTVNNTVVQQLHSHGGLMKGDSGGYQAAFYKYENITVRRIKDTCKTLSKVLCALLKVHGRCCNTMARKIARFLQ